MRYQNRYRLGHLNLPACRSPGRGPKMESLTGSRLSRLECSRGAAVRKQAATHQNAYNRLSSRGSAAIPFRKISLEMNNHQEGAMILSCMRICFRSLKSNLCHRNFAESRCMTRRTGKLPSRIMSSFLCNGLLPKSRVEQTNLSCNLCSNSANLMKIVAIPFDESQFAQYPNSPSLLKCGSAGSYKQ